MDAGADVQAAMEDVGDGPVSVRVSGGVVRRGALRISEGVPGDDDVDVDDYRSGEMHTRLFFSFLIFLILSIFTAQRIAFDAHYYRLAGYVQAEEWRMAILEGDKALNCGPHDPNIYFLRGLAFLEFGKAHRMAHHPPFAARRDFREAAEYFPHAVYLKDAIKEAEGD